MINKIFDFIIFYFGKFLTRRIAKYFFDYKVVNILREANNYFDIGSLEKVINLKNNRIFRGLINSYISTDDKYPNALDIAVAVKISLGEFNNKYDQNILDFSFHLLSELKKILKTDPILKLAISDLGKDLIRLDDIIDRDKIITIMSNKKSLFIHYFNEFNDKRYNYAIRVWHQSNENSWIEWKIDDSIIVNLNPVRIREGFFMVGFDYTQLNNHESLDIAGNENGYEYFNKPMKNNVWYR